MGRKGGIAPQRDAALVVVSLFIKGDELPDGVEESFVQSVPALPAPLLVRILLEKNTGIDRQGLLIELGRLVGIVLTPGCDEVLEREGVHPPVLSDFQPVGVPLRRMWDDGTPRLISGSKVLRRAARATCRRFAVFPGSSSGRSISIRISFFM